jgi:hypothetical protein
MASIIFGSLVEFHNPKELTMMHLAMIANLAGPTFLLILFLLALLVLAAVAVVVIVSMLINLSRNKGDMERRLRVVEEKLERLGKSE